MSYRALAVLLAVVPLAAASCSSDEPALDDEPTVVCEPFDYASFDGQDPAVSFEGDVYPLLRRGCGFSSCHGVAFGGKAALFLGPNLNSDAGIIAADAGRDDAGRLIDPEGSTLTEAEIRQLVVDGLVHVPSRTAPAMNLVEPGDPEQSFLMLKLEGCQAEANLTCEVQSGAQSDNPCGDLMPRNGEKLPDAELDVIRRWILQGAKND
jgi:hypothetical protein